MGEGTLRARVAAVRAFNRFYTRRIGVLRRRYLGGPFSLTQVRVLYEIAHRRRATAAALVRDLDLNPGYLSRLLSGFERRGLIRRTPSPADRRQSFLALTRRGSAAFDPLDARSETETAAMLRALPPAGQVRLVAAMRAIEALLDRGGRISRPAARAPSPRSAR